MTKIAVITDTDASLPKEIAEEFNIKQVPITVHFGEETFSTGIDIDDAYLFDRVDREGKLPTTAAPAPGAFAKAFQEAFDGGADEIICLCVSSKISGTYNSALSALEMHPERDISVIDTQSVCMGQGFMTLTAAKAIEQGASKEEAIAQALDIGKRMHLYAALSTLKYLAMSGRVGKLVAGLADAFDVKPILTMQDGKLELLERVRTQKKAEKQVIELTRQAVGQSAIERMAIVHINDLDGAHALHEKLCAILPCPEEIITAEFSAGLSVHTGSGVVGVVLATGN
jgi:DegV family protein with EDD domain